MQYKLEILSLTKDFCTLLYVFDNFIVLIGHIRQREFLINSKEKMLLFGTETR